MPDRESIELKVFGMNGIPNDFIEMRRLTKGKLISARVLVLHYPGKRAIEARKTLPRHGASAGQARIIKRRLTKDLHAEELVKSC